MEGGGSNVQGSLDNVRADFKAGGRRCYYLSYLTFSLHSRHPRASGQLFPESPTQPSLNPMTSLWPTQYSLYIGSFARTLGRFGNNGRGTLDSEMSPWNPSQKVPEVLMPEEGTLRIKSNAWIWWPGFQDLMSIVFSETLSLTYLLYQNIPDFLPSPNCPLARLSFISLAMQSLCREYHFPTLSFRRC